MLAALEIGNSNIVFALMKDGEVKSSWRIPSDRSRTAAEYAAHLSDLVNRDLITGVALASVVPALEPVLASASEQAFGLPVTVISWAGDLGITNRCNPPESVGIDRLLNASAAFSRFGGAAITVDMGTATTLDVVNSRGEFIGGAIAPGLRTSADALFDAAPRLPRVDLALPPTAIADNTEDALRSGIVLGYALMVDGMVNRIREELGEPATVIATGGLAHVIEGRCRTIDQFDPNLTLSGIWLAHKRLRGSHA